jgi:hypothetical protein
MKDEPSITLPLSEFTHLALGSGDCGGFCLTTPLIATLVKTICKDEYMLHVQTHSREGSLLAQPKLWHIAAWRNDTERWLCQQRYQAEQRDIRRVFEENIKIVSRRIRLSLELDEDAANLIAYRLMSKKMFKQIRAHGVTNLISNVGELDEAHKQILQSNYEPPTETKKDEVKDDMPA